MGIIKDLTFDGVSLSDYGVGITGAGVYNAPKRAVNMITIPGRDGDYALDEGRYENIEVTYPAGAFDTNQPDYAGKMSDLRNELASRIGYKRLEDEYNPDEYRLGIFKDGLDVSPAHYSRAGEFDLVFNCKPQRFLKSGETEQEITSGGTITNPTLFGSKPLLLVEGYGAINMGGEDITLEDIEMGEVLLANASQKTMQKTATAWYYAAAASKLNLGDPVTLKSSVISFDQILSDETIESATGGSGVSVALINGGARWSIDTGDINFVHGTASTVTLNFSGSFVTNNGSYTMTITVTAAYAHAGNGDYIIRMSWATSGGFGSFLNGTVNFGEIGGDSSQSALGTPTYIDLDIGECYKIEDGNVVAINNAVTLPADLPTLSPGANAVTFDNTITSLKIIPRWWKI